MDFCRSVEQGKPTKDIRRKERLALGDLKKNKEIVITQADKGNSTVVLDRADYERKALELLVQRPFRRLLRDPTTRIENRVNDLLKKLLKAKEITQSTYEHPLKGTRPPLFYGSAKIHKENVPLRPIVSTVGTATYKIAKRVSQILTPYVCQANNPIKNTRHFREKMLDPRIEEDKIMVSFDVKALFTSVPIREAQEVIEKVIRTDVDLPKRAGMGKEAVIELLKLCLSTSSFRFHETHYEQTDELAVGSPASPVIANLYMEKFEEEALSSFTSTKPKIWDRYVDDVFAIMKAEKVDALLAHLNARHPSIQFTIEREKDGKLPFMDVSVRRTPEGQLNFDVYRKPTHNTHTHTHTHTHTPGATSSTHPTTQETGRKESPCPYSTG